MNTPDTKIADSTDERSLNNQMIADRAYKLGCEDRDTYWKERVEEERERLLKVIDDSNLGGQLDWLINDIKSK